MFPCVNDKQSIIFDEFQACNAIDNIELKAGGDGIDTQDTACGGVCSLSRLLETGDDYFVHGLDRT